MGTIYTIEMPLKRGNNRGKPTNTLNLFFPPEFFIFALP